MRFFLQSRPAIGAIVFLVAVLASAALATSTATNGPSPRRAPPSSGRSGARVTTAPSAAITEKISPSEPKSPTQWYTQGLALAEAGDWVQARACLSTALCSEQLTKAHEGKAVEVLGEAAEQLFFGAEVFPDDPVTYRYLVQEGQTLRQIIRQEKLHVPADLIAQINGLPAGSVPGAGLELKLIRGPVHALVHKHDFALDLYVLDAEGHKLIIKRMTIGLGKQDSTPTGQYLVGPKAVNPDWHPPASSKLAGRGVIRWGEADYPFGREAYWIGLDAADTDGVPASSGLGLHSTSDQLSIGTTRSLGCIRIGKADIPTLYMLLSTGASTVQIDP